MGWLIALGVILLLGIMPVGICAQYAEGGPQIRLITGPFKFPLYPSGKKTEKKAAPEKKPDETLKKATGKKKGGKLSDFLPLVDTVLEFLRDFHKSLRIRNLQLDLVLAGGDPCDLAVNYGRAWAALGNLLPALERMFTIQKRNLDISCDFVERETRVCARVDLTMRLVSLVRIVLHRGVRIIFKYYEISNKRKGGAKV